MSRLLKASIGDARRALVPLLSFLVFSAGTASAQTVLHQLEGQMEFDFFGMSVSDAGDVDADGHDDFVLGMLGYNALGSRAEVYSGRTGSLLYTFGVTGIGGAAGAGDVNADGHADVIVGDAGFAGPGIGTGRALVFSGKTGALLYTFTGDAASDYFGGSVDGAGDVDGDGFDDLVVGAYQPDSFNPGTGYVRIFSGQDGTQLYEFTGDSPGDAFGSSVSGAGDVDGDGYDDVIVGAPWDDNNGMSSGMARVFSGRTGGILYQFDGGAGDGLGRSVSDAGDVNNDGFDDVVVGLPDDDTGAQLAGSVRVFSGLDGSPLHTFLGDFNDHLGDWVSGAGDVNGDCFDDVIASSGKGNPSYARVYSGVDGSIIYEVNGLQLFGVSGAGDVNRDGKADVIVADPIIDVGPGHEVGIVTVYSGVGAPTISAYCLSTVNSTGGSASAYMEGCTSVAANDLVLSAAPVPNQPGLFYYGPNQTQVPFGNGFRCVGGPQVFRLDVSVASGNVLSHSLDIANPPAASGQITPGSTWNFQAWFRDPAAGGAFFNLSDALSLTFSP